MLGASGGRWLGSARRTCRNSWRVGPAMLADGTGGNGRTEPSDGAATCWASAGDRAARLAKAASARLR